MKLEIVDATLEWRDTLNIPLRGGYGEFRQTN